MEKVLRGCDVALQRGGAPAGPGRATEVAIQFRKQKADQAAFGMTRTHYASGEKLCVVEAVARVAHVCPERFGKGWEAALPLCRWARGTVPALHANAATPPTFTATCSHRFLRSPPRRGLWRVRPGNRDIRGFVQAPSRAPRRSHSHSTGS